MNDQKKSWKENLAEEYNNAMQDGEERETASQVSYSKLNLSVTEWCFFRNGSV